MQKLSRKLFKARKGGSKMGDEGLLIDPQSLENAIVSSDTGGLSLTTAVQNAIETATAAGKRNTTIDLSSYQGQDVMQLRVTLNQNNYQLSQTGSVLTINW